MSLFSFHQNRLFKSAYSENAWIIAGLGNPGTKYEDTRHNAGFLALDDLANSLHTPVKKLKFRALLGEAAINGCRVLLMKPQTFMNLSGESIRDAADFYKIPPEHILILCDDAALPLGKLRVRRKGSDGGHNGLKNILSRLQSDAFPRIRIGVGAPPHADTDMADWVLSRFAADEKKILLTTVRQAADAARLLICDGVDAAMQKYN